MVSLLGYMVENKSLQDLARAWGVSQQQTVRRLRMVPFAMLKHSDSGDRHRGRPGRSLALNPGWRFWAQAGKMPLRELLRLLQTLHALGEPFALGVPLTSTFWRPFLNPEVRLLAPFETFSLWQRLFAGTAGTLTVVVDLLPDSARHVEAEGLPVLDPAFAVVDALLGFEGTRNLNVLALADWLAHGRPVQESAMSFAASHGVDGDVRFLQDHRRREGRVVRRGEVQEAHLREQEMARVPAETAFHELLSREALSP